jgi:hypothetical protein
LIGEKTIAPAEYFTVMTPLDRIFDKLSISKDLLALLDENLPLIVGIPFFLLILLIFFWAFIGSNRKAARIVMGLKKKGYRSVQPDDPQLKKALERLTPIMFHTYELSTVRETSPWRVKLACAQDDGWTTRYFALINRSVSRSTPQETLLGHEFTIAFLEMRTLPFTRDVHVAGDRYTLDPQYGLTAVPAESLGALSTSYVVYSGDGTIDPLPLELRNALAESASFLSIRAEQKQGTGPFLFHARIRFTPEGWGLISSEYVYDEKKMSTLLKVVDCISKALQ